ncbi:MAG: hypothetical protein K8R19_08490 [Methanosarcinales archaeon]|nr:hypothetical protein [Methanosarcinales archaeon]
MPEIRKRIPTEAIKLKKGCSEISFRVVGRLGLRNGGFMLGERLETCKKIVTSNTNII